MTGGATCCICAHKRPFMKPKGLQMQVYIAGFDTFCRNDNFVVE